MWISGRSCLSFYTSQTKIRCVRCVPCSSLSYRHAFYPRRSRQRYTLRLVMSHVQCVHPLFTICVISPMYLPCMVSLNSKLRATTEKFSRNRKSPAIFPGIEPLSGSSTCDHSTNETAVFDLKHWENRFLNWNFNII
ncbi:hypothetical protein SFRURICE_016667, partial [Spodoptera frugiperda]